MNDFLKKYLSQCGLALVLVMAGVANVEASGVLQDFDGKYRSLETFTGKDKWLVVMFWASDCHVCNAEVSQYIAFHDRHKASDATVLGVSLDSYAGLQAAKGFVERHAVSFPNLITDLQSGALLYTELSGDPWIGTPAFLIYSPKGELLARQAGAVPASIIDSFIVAPRPSTRDD